MKKIWLGIAVVVIVAVATAALLFSIKGKGCLTTRGSAAALPTESQLLYQQGSDSFSEGQIAQAISSFQKIARDFPESSEAAGAWYKLAMIYERENMLAEARLAYQKVINGYSGSAFVKRAQRGLGDLNIRILFSPQLDSISTGYLVQEGDSLGAIAKRFNTTVDLLRKANDLGSRPIQPQMYLKVPTCRFSVIVDKSQNTLTLKADEKVFKIYKVSTGKEACTPTGKFEIINKKVDPPWYTTGAVLPPDSPENILGSRWMGLSKRGYGIHGTTDPSSIGKQVTAGCVRMFNKDVKELFVILPRGTEVTIID